MSEQFFEYQNKWSTPRLGFATDLLYPNIGNYVSSSSLVSGLTLDEFQETKSVFRSLGSFKVTGQYTDVKLFAQALEKDYKEYIEFFCDWDRTDQLFT
jgi:hypothetical protein